MADTVWAYPPSPQNIPANLTKSGLRYHFRILLVLLSLFLVLLIYLTLVVGSLVLMGWVIWPVFDGFSALGKTWTERFFILLLRCSFFAFATLLFVFLLKGFFKRGESVPASRFEITEAEQPEFFEFLRMVCRDIGCSVPQRVFLTYDVNACVFFATSILNLIVPPRKDLLIGLGLLHGLDLVEFKALLAHELGHFSQRSMRLGGYVAVFHQVIDNMVNTRDRWDRWVIRGIDTPWVSAFAFPLHAVAEMTRAILSRVFHYLIYADLSLKREMEFNADLVAVSVAGSDAIVQLLFKSELWNTYFQRTAEDLVLPSEQGLYTRDLYYHQERARDLFRKLLDQPTFGHLPDLPSDPTCRGEDLFKPGDIGKAAMWLTHPSNHDREQNAKKYYIRSPQNDQSAWLLFRDSAALRQESTLIFNRTQLNFEPDDSLDEPERIQAFMDDERMSTTFDSRYRGIYDNRLIELSDIRMLIDVGASDTVTDAIPLLDSIHGLYTDDLECWVTASRRRFDELQFVEGLRSGRTPPKGRYFDFRGEYYTIDEAKKIWEMLQIEMNEARRFLADFDQSVFRLHDQLAVKRGRESELRLRYTSHLRLQKLLETAWALQGQVGGVLEYIYAQQHLNWELISQLQETLSSVGEQNKVFLQQTEELFLPPLVNLDENDSVGSYLPEVVSADLIVRNDFATFNVCRVERFHQWLTASIAKLNWLHVKSLYGILRLQEALVAVQE